MKQKINKKIWSLFCIDQLLLGMGPMCGWYSQWHSIRANWLSICWKISIANFSCFSMGPHLNLNLLRFRACCHSLCVASVQSCYVWSYTPLLTVTIFYLLFCIDLWAQSGSKDVPCRTECFQVSHSECYLAVGVLLNSYQLQEASLVRAEQGMDEDTALLLGISLFLCSFSRKIIMGFPVGMWSIYSRFLATLAVSGVGSVSWSRP